MLKLHRWQRFVLTFVVAAAALALAGEAVADTIYLKNGRTIRSAQVRVEGDRVIFIQYGGEVALPMSIVDRIEQDTSIGPDGTPSRPPQAEASDTESSESGEGTDTGGEGDSVPEDQTQEYWQSRVRANMDEREQVQLQIEDLRRQERAFLFSHRSTADTHAAIEAAQERLTELEQAMADIRTDARQAGIPPGWLRLPEGEGGGGGGSGGSGGGMNGGSGS